MDICVEEMLGDYQIDQGHSARCWNDSRAPKIEMPITIKNDEAVAVGSGEK